MTRSAEVREARREQIGEATLILGDSFEAIQSAGMFDCVATDPPYGIGYVSARRKRGPTEMLENDDAAPIDIIPSIAGSLKDGGALYLATRFDVAAQWNAAIKAAGLILKTPIYWNKGNHTSGDLEGDFGAQVEIFIFAHKGRHSLRGRRLANLWHVPRDPAGEHPTPKPIALMERMISCSTDAGGAVLDPFMGSGSTGVAAVNLGRRFTGIEVNKRFFEIACERIQAAHAQQRLFA